METTMDKKINKISKAGRVITSIVAVFMILAAIATAIGIGVVATLPKDALQIKVSGTADVVTNGKALAAIADAVIDSANGGDGKVSLGEVNNGKTEIVIGDVKGVLPQGVNAQKTQNGLTLSVNNKNLDIDKNAILFALIMTLLNTVCVIVIVYMVRNLMKSLEGCETPFCDSVIKNMKRFGFSLIPYAFLKGLSENSWDLLSVNVHLGIDLTVVFGILIVFMLVMIFTYGAQLQRESDETL